jgi:hypothetical protein
MNVDTLTGEAGLEGFDTQSEGALYACKNIAVVDGEGDLRVGPQHIAVEAAAAASGDAAALQADGRLIVADQKRKGDGFAQRVILFVGA